MTFSRKILVGLGAGVAVGLTLGEYVLPLKLVADGFVRLLQMTVLPYVTISIISNLGALSLTQAKALAMRGGAVLVTLWALAFAVTFAMPIAFPPTETAAFFSTTMLEPAAPFDFVSLYIPSNPFNALANNVVPAVVLFSVLVGIALIGVERKGVLLDVLQVTSTVISRATHVVVSLTPYGLFAIAAVAAGTMTVEQLQRIQVYLLTYVAVALIVALWILPGLIATLTGIRIRDVFSRTRDSLIVAFVAGDLFIVLPGLIEACKELIATRPGAGTGAEASAGHQSGPDVIVPVSFNFPHTGKLLSLSFIPFAAWFSDASLSLGDYAQLFGAGLLSFFGSLNSAVPFLLDLFRLPADTFQLFLATGVINSRFGTLVAAMHTVTVAIIGSVALAGGVRFNAKAIARFAVVTVVLLVGSLAGLRVVFATVLQQEFAGADIVYAMQPLLGSAPATVAPALPPTPPQGVNTDVLDAIRARGALRVIVLPDRMPFAFSNRENKLVGIDVELAQALAEDLGVRAEFHQVEYDDLPHLLQTGTCDIAMSGVAITSERAADLAFSEPYIDETLAFVTKDHLRDRFRTWESIREQGAIRVAVPDLPTYRRAIGSRAPNAVIVPLRRTEELFRADENVMAYVLPAERGSVLTLLHPDYSVVVPQPDTIRLPVAYPIARADTRWLTYVNTWLQLRRRDGTLDALYRHWILGQNAVRAKPRWSVVRSILGW